LGNDLNGGSYPPGSNGDNSTVFENQPEGCGEDQDVEDDSTSFSCGDKRPRSRTSSTYQWREPVKVHATKGTKPKAGDYEVAVQKVLSEAIPRYRGYLSMVTPYPGSMDEIRWAKKSWKDGCDECETWMESNNEIIRLVSARLLTISLRSPLPKITNRGSHFRGRIKTKVQPLVKSMYGFAAVSKPKAVDHNVKLARALKDKFGFIYAVRVSLLFVLFTHAFMLETSGRWQ